MNEVFFMVASIDTTPTPTYSMFVTVYYLGDLGSGNGLGGSFDVGFLHIIYHLVIRLRSLSHLQD